MKTKIEELQKRAYAYTISPYQDDDFIGYVGKYNDLPVEVYGLEEAQTLLDLVDAKEEYFHTAIKENLRIPDVKILSDCVYSGRVTARLGSSLHEKVVKFAKNDGISLNQALLFLLERGLAGDKLDKIEMMLEKLQYDQTQSTKTIFDMKFEGYQLTRPARKSGEINNPQKQKDIGILEFVTLEIEG